MIFSRVHATLRPALSVPRSDGWSHFTFFYDFFSLTSLLLPKWSGDLKYGPCPPAPDLSSRVSGLVTVNFIQPAIRSIGFEFRRLHIFPCLRPLLARYLLIWHRRLMQQQMALRYANFRLDLGVEVRRHLQFYCHLRKFTIP